MQLLSDEMRAQLPTLYAQIGERDPIVHAKFFSPWTGWSWFVIEGWQEEDDFIFFGYVIGLKAEWRYFSLRELESLKGPCGLRIKRDENFTPKRASELESIVK